MNPLDVTWSERYSKSFDRYWSIVPSFIAKFLVTFAIIMLGSSIHGDWLLFFVHFFKYMHRNDETTVTNTSTPERVDEFQSWSQFSLKPYRLEGLGYFIIPATIISYATYFCVGGLLHWYYYVRQRDRPEEWKCQPNKWLPAELELHEIKLGSLSLFVGSIISGVTSCYISNGGWTAIYYDVSDFGWVWFFLQLPVVFIWQDYWTYWTHRLYHTPFLYKHFHKLHHTYKQPTAFSVTAIHPFEFMNIQAVMMSPMCFIPTHWINFSAILVYSYYHGIIDHSGINFKAYWWQPWQPHCIFHDNHHQYFHVNFGFNIKYWDMIHGTYRQKDRIYREDIFYGKGKPLDQASETELANDMAQRQSENPLAYENDTNAYELSSGDLKKD